MNIEVLVITELAKALTVPVSADVPADRPKTFVTLERTGGGKNSTVIDSATVAVQSWAETRFGATTLADTVDKAILSLFDDSPVVSDIDRNSGPYNWPDPDSKSARYQAVYDIIYHNEY